MYTSNTSNTFSDVDHRKTTAHLNQGKNMALTGRNVRVYFFKSSGWSADTNFGGNRKQTPTSLLTG